jgi:hypothetical protein
VGILLKGSEKLHLLTPKITKIKTRIIAKIKQHPPIIPAIRQPELELFACG